jgi:hypothetical protein
MAESQLVAASTTESQEDLERTVAPTKPVEAQPEAEPAQEQERHSKSAYQKRIDKIVRERETARSEAAQLRARLAQYEPLNGEPAGALESRAFAEIARRKQENGNGAQPTARQDSLPEEKPTAQPDPRPADTPAIAALRSQYPDWDEVMTRAKNENLRISDHAAAVMHALPNAGHMVYMLASNPELRAEVNKLSDADAAAYIQRLNRDIATVHSGGYEFSKNVRASLSQEEIQEALNAGKNNLLGAALVTSLMKEINVLPNGPQVFKYIMSDPETCKKLAGLSREGAGVQLGRISVMLESSEPEERGETGGRVDSYQAEEPRRASGPPAPIRPVGGSATKISVPLDNLPYPEFRAEREKQERQRYRR